MHCGVDGVRVVQCGACAVLPPEVTVTHSPCMHFGHRSSADHEQELYGTPTATHESEKKQQTFYILKVALLILLEVLFRKVF